MIEDAIEEVTHDQTRYTGLPCRSTSAPARLQLERELENSIATDLYGRPYIFSSVTAQGIPKNYLLICAYNFDGVLSRTQRNDEYVRQSSSDDGHYCGHEYYYDGVSNGGDADDHHAHRPLYTVTEVLEILTSIIVFGHSPLLR